MTEIVTTNHLTLDGVTQAPGRPDEDRRGGFHHGGWALAQGGALSLGRQTYEDFYDSTTLEEPLPGQLHASRERCRRGRVPLKEQAGRHIAVLGSGELARSLMRHELVDLFPDGVPIPALTLVDSLTTTGVVIATSPAAA